jgi:hypothetical protein
LPGRKLVTPRGTKLEAAEAIRLLGREGLSHHTIMKYNPHIGWLVSRPLVGWENVEDTAWAIYHDRADIASSRPYQGDLFRLTLEHLQLHPL